MLLYLQEAEAYIAVCVEKANAVWHLEHIVMPFTKEGQRHGLKCRWKKLSYRPVITVQFSLRMSKPRLQ